MPDGSWKLETKLTGHGAQKERDERRLGPWGGAKVSQDRRRQDLMTR
jgi:hypothetical protein